MVVHVREREPVQIIRGGSGAPAMELTGRRFMGTLLHPVPAGDMQKRCGLFHHGHRISVDWPAGATEDHPVRPGDSLEVGGKTYPVCACVERPGCYLDIYVGEA